MFAYSNLYTDNQQARIQYAIHALGLSWVAGNEAGGNINAIRATLGLTSLTQVDPGIPALGKYLVAKDATGTQVCISEAGDARVNWSDIFTNGVDTLPGPAIPTFLRFKQWAQTIATALLAASSANDQFWFAGYGIGAAVSRLVGEILRANNRRSLNWYGVQCPRVTSEAGFDLFAMPGVHVWCIDDAFVDMPPVTMWTTRNGARDLFGLGRFYRPPGFTLTFRGRDPGIAIALARVCANERNNGPYSWPERIPDAFLSTHQLSTWVNGFWNELSAVQQQNVLEWLTILNGTYNFTLPQRLE